MEEGSERPGGGGGREGGGGVGVGGGGAGGVGWRIGGEGCFGAGVRVKAEAFGVLLETIGDAGADPEGVVSADLSAAAAAALDEDLEMIETGGIEDVAVVLILVGMVVRSEIVTGLGF